MTLENTIKALELAMQRKNVPTKLLQDLSIVNILGSFFGERETRPKLTSLIEFPSVMLGKMDFE